MILITDINVPSSDPKVAGAIWKNTAGQLMISAGPVVAPPPLTTIAGSPFYPLKGGQTNDNTGPTLYEPVVEVVSGKHTLDVSNIDNNIASGSIPLNTVVAQWMVDNEPIGPYITGPQNASGPRWPYLLDTAALSDGTHAYWLKVIDSTSEEAGTSPYAFKPLGGQIIVQNKGALNGAQRVPVISNANEAPKCPQAFADFIDFPGDTQRAVNTFDNPSVFAPPAYSPASPYASNPSALRSRENYYIENPSKLRVSEDEGDPMFHTTPQGGVFASSDMITNLGSTVETGTPNVRAFFPWDGGRYDTRLSALITVVADPRDSAANPTGFVLAELNGRVCSLSYKGKLATLIGYTLDREHVLPYDDVIARSMDAAQVMSRYKQVGTWQGFQHWDGINDICFDPRDNIYNTAYVANPVWHTIIKVTGLWSGNPTATLFAGIEGKAGLANGNASAATFDGPYSVCMDPEGNLYVADKYNGAIRKIDSSGNVTTLAGIQNGKPTEEMLYNNQEYSPALLDRYAPASVSASSAYVNYPVQIRFASSGDLVFLESDWHAIRRIWLSGPNAGTITLVAVPESTYPPYTGFSTFDIDNPFYPFNAAGMPPGAAGACGPLDDIMMILTPEGFGGQTSARISLDGSVNETFSADGAGWNMEAAWIPDAFNQPVLGWTSLNEGSPDLISDNFGVYTWVVCFSKTQARMATGGFRYDGVLLWRSTLPNDPDPGLDKGLFAVGHEIWKYGAPLCFPMGSRPSFGQTYGKEGFGHLGSDVGPTIHDMAVKYNGGASYNAEGDAALQAFFVGGCTGSYPRPELGVAEGSSAINNDWAALSYWIRRATTAGSYPGPVAMPGPLNTDNTLPQVSNVVATRLSETSMTVAWNTDKQTIGMALAASSSAFAAAQWKYAVWSPIETGYGTSHSATITQLPPGSPIHFTVLVKDEAGNHAYYQDQTIT